MRLAKFLAVAGVASRRTAEEIVRAQRVTVNGATVTDPARDVTDADAVAVDGAAVAPEAERVVYAVNKPVGVVSTASDPQRRPTVVSLVPSPVRLYPVGRLDIDTTGLILLTNDGALAYRLTHPSFEVPRTYRVVVVRPPVCAGAAQRHRAGGRPHGPGAGAPPGRPRRDPRAHHPRGAKAPGQAHVRGGRAPGPLAATRGVRAARPGHARPRCPPAPLAGRDRGAQPGWSSSTSWRSRVAWSARETSAGVSLTGRRATSRWMSNCRTRRVHSAWKPRTA
jgi:ribosomal 50S subunit-recycling heat shock protein